MIKKIGLCIGLLFVGGVTPLCGSGQGGGYANARYRLAAHLQEDPLFLQKYKRKSLSPGGFVREEFHKSVDNLGSFSELIENARALSLKNWEELWVYHEVNKDR